MNAEQTQTLLELLERIAAALEKQNILLSEQNGALDYLGLEVGSIGVKPWK